MSSEPQPEKLDGKKFFSLFVVMKNYHRSVCVARARLFNNPEQVSSWVRVYWTEMDREENWKSRKRIWISDIRNKCERISIGFADVKRREERKRILKSSNRSLFASETSLCSSRHIVCCYLWWYYAEKCNKNSSWANRCQPHRHSSTASQDENNSNNVKCTAANFEVFPSINFTRVEIQPAKTRPRPEERWAAVASQVHKSTTKEMKHFHHCQDFFEW